MTLRFSVIHLLAVDVDILTKRVCLRINTAKTETMCIGDLAELFKDGSKLPNVTRFKYLGSYVTSDCSMKVELASRLQVTSCAFGRLLDSCDLTTPTNAASNVRHCISTMSGNSVQYNSIILNIKWHHFCKQ